MNVWTRRQAGRSGAPPFPPRCGRLGATTALLAAPAVLAACVPTLADRAAYDRTRIAAGEVWRVVTCHWTHWTFEHLAWDLLAFAVLTRLCLALGRRRTFATLAVASLTIPLGVWLVLPGMQTYRGLSGLDSALFTLLAGTLLAREVGARSWGPAALLATTLSAFVGKVAFELATGTTVFVSGGGFVPVALAHVLGGACGLLVALGAVRVFPQVAWRARRGQIPRPGPAEPAATTRSLRTLPDAPGFRRGSSTAVRRMNGAPGPRLRGGAKRAAQPSDDNLAETAVFARFEGARGLHCVGLAGAAGREEADHGTFYDDGESHGRRDAQPRRSRSGRWPRRPQRPRVGAA